MDCQDHTATAHEEQLLLDLYCAETLERGPCGLSLRKVWAPFDPDRRDTRSTRGYYIVQTGRGGLHYRRYCLADAARAQADFDAMVLSAELAAATLRCTPNRF